jgi:hypothetical protein
VLGREKALALVDRMRSYAEIRRLVRDDERGFDDLLERHGLVVPDTPAIPQRIVARRAGDSGMTVALGDGRPTVTLVEGSIDEHRVADALRDLYERYPLERWQYTTDVFVQRRALCRTRPLTLRTGLDRDMEGLLAVYLELQLAWFCAGVVDEPPKEAIAWNTLAVLRELLPASELARVVARSRWAELFAEVAVRFDALGAELGRRGLRATDE